MVNKVPLHEMVWQF